MRIMYGNVDVGLRWQKAFIKLCTNNEIKCIQRKTDPCMLYKKDEKGRLSLMIALYFDNVLISGREKDVKEFQAKLKKT